MTIVTEWSCGPCWVSYIPLLVMRSCIPTCRITPATSSVATRTKPSSIYCVSECILNAFHALCICRITRPKHLHLKQHTLASYLRRDEAVMSTTINNLLPTQRLTPFLLFVSHPGSEGWSVGATDSAHSATRSFVARSRSKR